MLFKFNIKDIPKKDIKTIKECLIISYKDKIKSITWKGDKMTIRTSKLSTQESFDLGTSVQTHVSNLSFIQQKNNRHYGN